MFQLVACGKRRTYVLNKYGVLQVCNILCLNSQGTILGLYFNESFSFTLHLLAHICYRASDLFSHVRKIAKKKKLLRVITSVCMSVCVSAWNSSAPNGRIFTKFDV